MVKTNLLYLSIAAALFFAFVYQLDASKVKADTLLSKVSYQELKHQWRVTEVKNISTGIDISEGSLSRTFEFLSSGGFVEYENKIISKTGDWQVVDNRLHISYDTRNKTLESYLAELITPDELLLLKGNVQLRLLRHQL